VHHRVDEVGGRDGSLSAELGWDDNAEAAGWREDLPGAGEALEAFADGGVVSLQQRLCVAGAERVLPDAQEVVGQSARRELRHVPEYRRM
jgi:hypothetical protein